MTILTDKRLGAYEILSSCIPGAIDLAHSARTKRISVSGDGLIFSWKTARSSGRYASESHFCGSQLDFGDGSDSLPDSRLLSDITKEDG